VEARDVAVVVAVVVVVVVVVVAAVAAVAAFVTATVVAAAVRLEPEAASLAVWALVMGCAVVPILLQEDVEQPGMLSYPPAGL
jgi:hypothetical protein